MNIVDTPGHADFGGEVERSLLKVDAVLLLKDAAEGLLPQTRYVLQKAMARGLPVVVAINKIDRSDARPAEVVDQVYELFMDLGADEHQIEPHRLHQRLRRDGHARSRGARHRSAPAADLLVAHTAPHYEDEHPLQLLVDEPLGQRLRRPDGHRAHPQRHDPDGPAHHRGARGGRVHRWSSVETTGRSR
ncbi:MAG: GTP-binding protein [Chloroflexota bacterium]